MDPVGDMSWMRLLYALGPKERFKFQGLRALGLSVPATPEHHNERYRYRILLFESLAASPSILINLESDLLGAWLLTAQTAAGRAVLESYDELPAYDSFRARALEAVAAILNGEASSTARPERGILKP